MVEELPEEDGNGRQTAIDRQRERDKGKGGEMQLSRRWTDTTRREQKLDAEGIYKTHESGRSRLDPSTHPALNQKLKRWTDAAIEAVDGYNTTVTGTWMTWTVC